MNRELPDIERFERLVFQKKSPLNLLLDFSLKLLEARHVGVLFGTNRTRLPFLAPEKWDRGIMHKFNGRGLSGWILKYFGTLIVHAKGLSPVRLYKENQFGDRQPTDGIISFVLRTYKDFYRQGVKILLIDVSDSVNKLQDNQDSHSRAVVLSYDGETFRSHPDLKINTAIVKQFKARNFVSAYIPDYGAIVFNTIQHDLLQKKEGRFVYEAGLSKRLNCLISAIEMASLAYIGQARGRQAAHVIWRKEKHLRKTASQLQEKVDEVNTQKQYLKAVGAVNEIQLNMEAVNVPDGVYAFMDMVGSAQVRKHFSPKDYFFILNLCHQVAANNAHRFGCRVDNFMGDCVFLLNASLFDESRPGSAPVGMEERIMLMAFCVGAIFNEIDALQRGDHALDPNGRAKKLIRQAGVFISFRAGLEVGPAMIGPLGSRKRKIVTAIGKTVNNASRLESSGEAKKIHISEEVMTRLYHAGITKESSSLWQLVKENGRLEQTADPGTNSLDFLESYKNWFCLDGDVIEEKNNVSYKEFSPPKTFLVKSVPDHDPSILSHEK